MKSFFEQKGTLKVVLAKGILSTYEINELKKGGYIHFNDRDCGDLFSLYFNSVLVGYGTVVILSEFDEVGLRLSRLTWEPRKNSEVILSRDNEILETELVLGEREISFNEISNLAPGGVVSVNTYSEVVSGKPTTGLVRSAGIDIAKGNISINKDKWCLEITQSLVRKVKELVRRDSYLNIDSEYKYYNFTMPDCLTRDQLNNIKNVHQFFAKYIGGEVISVDQLIWKELKEEHSLDTKLLVFKKPQHSAKETDNKMNYFLPLNDRKENSDIEAWFKDNSIKEKYNQLMERVAVVEPKNNKNDLFYNSSNRAVDLLESSWRNISFLGFGESSSENMNISSNDFIGDYDMIIIACMKINNEWITIVYPHKYLVQIFEELK